MISKYSENGWQKSFKKYIIVKSVKKKKKKKKKERKEEDKKTLDFWYKGSYEWPGLSRRPMVKSNNFSGQVSESAKASTTRYINAYIQYTKVNIQTQLPKHQRQNWPT